MPDQLAHWLTGGAAMWVVSAILRAMPAPKPEAPVWYVWLFNFAGIVGANFDKLGGPASK